jgi:hypothetical protein
VNAAYIGIFSAGQHPLLAQSAIDRLTSTCHELIVEGDSYRRRQRPAAPPVDEPAPATR